MSELIIEPKRTGPSMSRGSSKQDYATPRPFIAAVEKRFGPLAWDLAAHAQNSVCGSCYCGPDSLTFPDSLAADWGELWPSGNLWLNPPFANIAPWAEKCASVSNRLGFTFLLTPASVGSNWFADHVHGKAFVMPIAPRLAFNGESYPRDLMLAVFGFGVVGFEPWRWDAPTPTHADAGTEVVR